MEHTLTVAAALGFHYLRTHGVGDGRGNEEYRAKHLVGYAVGTVYHGAEESVEYHGHALCAGYDAAHAVDRPCGKAGQFLEMIAICEAEEWQQHTLLKMGDGP